MKKQSNDWKSLTPGLRAFIYQQVMEFEAYFTEDSQVGIEVLKDKDSGLFKLILVLTGGGTYVKSEGTGSDIYEATIAAKSTLLNHLRKVEAKVAKDTEVDSQQEELIQTMGSGKRYLH